jgi:hypothetical protein
MLFYDAVATALFVYARIDLGLSGILLWLGVIIHGILGVWCVMGLKGKKKPSIDFTGPCEGSP